VAIALRTSRLLLREWRDGDCEPFAAISADPEVMAMLPPLPDRAASDAWIERMRAHLDQHGFAYWAVELPEKAELIGAIGLSRVRFPAPFTPAVEIGWRLARAHWGKGYAFEAAQATIEDGFFRLALDEIVAFTVPANQRSWRVMERLGMMRDPADDFDFPSFPEDHPRRRHVLYRICRPEP
jgi:RimJ/RimL family protein N-acetyltransferase